MILVILTVYFVFSSSFRRNTNVHYRHHYQSQGNAVEILNERFAKGEITKEQYLQMRKTMEEN